MLVAKIKKNGVLTDNLVIVENLSDRIDIEGNPIDCDELVERGEKSESVKKEAAKRILDVADENQQRNMLAEAAFILDIAKSSRTEAQKARVEELKSIWAYIEAVRDASNILEAMDPIPQDFQNDSYWPEKPE